MQNADHRDAEVSHADDTDVVVVEEAARVPRDEEDGERGRSGEQLDQTMEDGVAVPAHGEEDDGSHGRAGGAQEHGPPAAER